MPHISLQKKTTGENVKMQESETTLPAFAFGLLFCTSTFHWVNSNW